jgi:hypothetical protein
MDMTTIFNVVILAIATSVISVTITRARVFREFRMFLDGKNEWIHSLFTCSYCMSHWVAAALVIAYDVRLIHMWAPRDILVTIFVVVGLATLVSALIQRVNAFGKDPPGKSVKKPVEEDEPLPNVLFNNPNQQKRRKVDEEDDL